jgi:hypothetical protein
VVVMHILPSFGIFWLEKSGNPDAKARTL